MHTWKTKWILLLLLPGMFLTGGCSLRQASPDPSPVPALSSPAAPAVASTLSASFKPADSEPPLLTITEVMVRNHATFRDSDGDFPDWIEIRNDSGEDVNLAGWSLSDRINRDGLVFPAYLLPAYSTFIVYASGKDRPEELHAPFSLSAGEDLYLRSPEWKIVSQVSCPDLPADRSWALQEDGSWRECLYPTPCRENTAAAYDTLQNEAVCQSPLQLYEVLVSDPNASFSKLGGSDWVELRNVSDEPIELSDWYLSDDDDNLKKAILPAMNLPAGGTTVVSCDQLGLSLGSESEALFLTQKGAGLQDWLVLRDIPLGGSFGRMSGRNGAFFFAKATPGVENQDGMRRVSAMPTALTADGIFDGSEPVSVNLSAQGTIYYTLDTTVPTASSTVWTGPLILSDNCVVRAVSVEPGALPSRPLTLNYFIGESYALPVLSLVSDNKASFRKMMSVNFKGQEWGGNVSWYEDGGSFSAPCGISLHGDTSLICRKKGLSVKFRGCYGQKELNYDLFGGGVTRFTDLVIRGGQDQTSAIIRNELCENLALSSSDHVIASRSRYCVVYIDNVYYGIYAVGEKFNEQLYADLVGVDENMVVTVNYEVPRSHDLYLDVFEFCASNDMSDPENYAHFCSLMDVDSLIDWVFLEGYCANSDLTYGNLRFCRSLEGDSRWRFMFYDLDATLRDPNLNHSILLRRNNIQCVQVSRLFADLLVNSEFRDRFLRRAAELLNGPLSNEAILREIDRLADEIAPEVARDFAMEKRPYKKWEEAVDALRNFITDNDWKQHNINAVCYQLRLTDEERAKYFG